MQHFETTDLPKRSLAQIAKVSGKTLPLCKAMANHSSMQQDDIEVARINT